MTGEVVITLCGAGAADTAGNDPELPVLPNLSTEARCASGSGGVADLIRARSARQVAVRMMLGAGADTVQQMIEG
jgi:hypothetical protein